MLTSFNSKKELKIAVNTLKEENPFFCTTCNKETILRKGNIRTHHFSHKVNLNCPRKEESELHLKTKLRIYNKMYSLFGNFAKLEYTNFKDFIPDVFVGFNKPFAFEIQCSNITTEVFHRRTQKYIDKKIFCYWIFPVETISVNEDNSIKLKRIQIDAMVLSGKNKAIYVYNHPNIEKWYLDNVKRFNEYYDQEIGDYNYSERTLKTIFKISKIEYKWVTK